MTPDRWRQLQELYDAVRNLTPAERSIRLKNAVSDVEFGRAESLFPVDSSDFSRAYEPSRDGQRFLITMPNAPGGAAFTVVLNWMQALGK